MPATLSRHSHRTPRVSILSALSHAHDTWRQRRALARLDDAALKDIGLSRADVASELRRPLWDAPEFWRN